MVGGGTAEGSATSEVEPLLLLVEAAGCRIALRAELVEEVLEPHDGEDAGGGGHGPEPTHGGEERTVQWGELLGLPSARRTPLRVVLRTPAGRAGLAADRFLGIRRVPLAATDPRPTLLLSRAGRPACHLLCVEGRPVFLLDPGILVERPATPLAADPAPPGPEGHEGRSRDGDS